jgi:hypothetical protein
MTPRPENGEEFVRIVSNDGVAAGPYRRGEKSRNSCAVDGLNGL